MQLKLGLLWALACTIIYSHAQIIDTTFHPNGNIYKVTEEKGNEKKVLTFHYGGQLAKEENFKNGRYHGKVAEYHTSGAPKYESNYNNALLEGEYIKYWSQEQPHQVLNYKIFTSDGVRESLLHGKAVYYQRDGNLNSEGKFKKGEKDGIWKKYDTSGRLVEETTYKDGKQEGEQIRYYPNGQISLRQFYYEEVVVDGVVHKGVAHGKQEVFYENGELQSVTMLEYGKPTGYRKYWQRDGSYSETTVQKNGSLISEAFTADGERTHYLERKKVENANGRTDWVNHGVEKSWKDGQLQSIKHYQEGQAHGPWIRYHLNGKIETKANYHKGALVGEFRQYWPDGEPREFIDYELDNLSSDNPKQLKVRWQRRWNEQGAVIYEAFYSLPDKAGYQGVFNKDGVLEKRIFNLYPAAGSSWSMEYYPDASLRAESFRFNPFNFHYTFFIDGSPNTIQHQTAYPQENMNVTLTPQGELHRGSLHNEKLRGEELDAIKPHLYEPASSEFYQGKEDGSFEVLYQNGSPRIRGFLKNKLLEGDLVLFRPSGDTLGHFRFDEALLEGESFMLAADGDTLLRSVFADGKLRERYQKHADGSVEIIRSDSLGAQNYSFKTYADGTPKNLDDKEKGIYKSWLEDGTLISHTRPVEGQESLILIERFHNNGQLSRKYYKKNGRDHGEFLSYYENGQLETRAFLQDGKQHGMYVSYFEDGGLRSKGEIVDGEKQGEWLLHRDGKVQSVYFKDNKERVRPPESACACIDTSISTGTYSYLNPVSMILDYQKFKAYSFDFLEPLDSAAYKALFFKRMGRWGEGVHMVPVLSYAQLRIPFDKNGNTRLLLNACHTPGYITSIDLYYRYHSQRPEQREFWFNKPKLRLELGSSLLNQKETPGKLFFSFEPERLVFDPRDKISLMPATTDVCFEEIRIGEWALVSGKGEMLFEVVPFPEVDTAALPPLPGGLKRPVPEVPEDLKFLTQRLREDTATGVRLTNASGYFNSDKGRFSWSSHNLWVTENWCGGSFVVECERIEEGEVLVLNSPGSKAFRLNIADLEKQLTESGLENLDLVRLARQNKVRVEFLNHRL